MKYSPDIVVVPECENFGDNTAKRLWIGDNRKKGLGVFSYSDFNLELDKNYDPAYKYILPIRTYNGTEFNLLAIWAMNDPKNVRRRYIGQVYLSLNHYKNILNSPSIIVGDFNWNAIWDDKPSYPLYGNLSDTVEFLADYSISSVYHNIFTEEFGKETNPTLFLHHKKEKSYHVDYCFTSGNFKINNVQVGIYSEWIASSDHMPLIIDIML